MVSCFEYVLLGDNIRDGAIAWITLGIYTSVPYDTTPAATHYEDLGATDSNSSSGGAAGGVAPSDIGMLSASVPSDPAVCHPVLRLLPAKWGLIWRRWLEQCCKTVRANGLADVFRGCEVEEDQIFSVYSLPLWCWTSAPGVIAGYWPKLLCSQPQVSVHLHRVARSVAKTSLPYQLLNALPTAQISVRAIGGRTRTGQATLSLD